MHNVENTLMSARKKMYLLATILSCLHFMYHFHAGLYSVLFIFLLGLFPQKTHFGDN